jgi:hypothetical protein
MCLGGSGQDPVYLRYLTFIWGQIEAREVEPLSPRVRVSWSGRRGLKRHPSSLSCVILGALVGPARSHTFDVCGDAGTGTQISIVVGEWLRVCADKMDLACQHAAFCEQT